MPKITPYFLLSNNKEEQARFKKMLSWGGGVSDDHFIEKDGKTYFNTEGTLLTSVVVEGSEDWYELFFFPNLGHFLTTRLNGNGQYEMAFPSDGPYGSDYPSTLLGQKNPDQEIIDVNTFHSLLFVTNAGGEVTITYQSGRTEKKHVDEQTFYYYEKYSDIFDDMRKYERDFVTISAERSLRAQQKQEQEIVRKLESGFNMLKSYQLQSFWAPNKNTRGDDSLKRTNSLPSLGNFG